MVREGVLTVVFIQRYHRIEQFVDTFARLRNGRHHRNAEQFAEQPVIQLRLVVLQFVVHVECHDHPQVDINQFRSKVEVAFEVRSRNDVHHHIRRMFEKLAPDIHLLRRIGRQCVSSGQVVYIELISLVTHVPQFGAYGDTAVIPHMFVTARRDIEQRGLSAIGVAHQRHVYPLSGTVHCPLHRLGCRRAADTFRLQRHIPGLFFRNHLYHLGFAATQRNLVLHHLVLDRVFQRSVLQNLHPLAPHESHLHDAAPESPMAEHLENNGALPCLQVGKTHIESII